MGSVKDLVILKEPSLDEEGVGEFVFSDRYSVFDWGRMPDLLQDKGKCLCIIGAYFFELLHKNNINTHYLGVVEDGECKSLFECRTPPCRMRIKLLRVIKPQITQNRYDYSVYKETKSNFLIPLEIIYRNMLFENSSLWRRLQEKEVSLEDLNLKEMPPLNKILESPIFDVSTKLESKDRYLTWQEAQSLSSLTEEELHQIYNILYRVNEIITQEYKKLDIINVDGKIEIGFDTKRKIIVVDVLGTPDECRFLYGDIQLSKEILRQFYRKTEWFSKIEEAKKIDRIGWKDKVKILPPPLPKDFKTLVENMYKSLTNDLTGKEWFSVPSFKDTVEQLSFFVKNSIK